MLLTLHNIGGASDKKADNLRVRTTSARNGAESFQKYRERFEL